VIDEEERMTERNKDLLGRLADLSEETIQRLADMPGADRVLQVLKGLADRVDELQRRTRGFEELEQRLSALEKRVDTLSRGRSRTASAGRSRSRTTKSSPAKKA
jgi:acyl carrier protein phosphodiesterase